MINACKVPFLWLVLVHQTTQFLILESNFYLRFVNDTVHKKANAYTKKIHTETGTYLCLFAKTDIEVGTEIR